MLKKSYTKKSFRMSPLSWYPQRGVLGDKCWPKKDDGVIGDKSLGWSLTVVRGIGVARGRPRGPGPPPIEIPPMIYSYDKVA